MVEIDSGSFRDPASRVAYSGGRVVRLLTHRGLADWRALAQTDFFARAVDEQRVIAATESQESVSGAAAVLDHPRIPTITYPYEWTFTMLKDAALLQLDLLRDALAEGITIKDATPYNIQFVAGRPLFIDVGSFEPYEEGEPWIGYRQFTRQFLFPLMMHAWVGIPFQPWLRGEIEGPTAEQMKAMLPSRKKMLPSVVLNVVLQARMEDRLADRSVREDLREAGFTVEMILTNVAKLRSLVESLQWGGGGPGWVDYHSCDHVARDRDTKAEFLRTDLDRSRPGRVLDLGANDGHFSIVAAESGAHVVAVDGDEAVLDDLYRRIEGRDVTIALSDLSNPSPSQGWAGKERPALLDRVSPDLVIAYGLIHHLIYSASIPVVEVLDWLRAFGCGLVLEFVSPDDEMVKKLTGNKLAHEIHEHGEEGAFRSHLGARFEIVDELRLTSDTRVLFSLRPA